MKKITVVLLLAVIFILLTVFIMLGIKAYLDHDSELDEAISILFVTTSVTYPGVPQQVQTLSRVHGVAIKYEFLRAFATLDDIKESVISEIQESKYDYVVLQDGSYRPVTELEEFFDVMRELCDKTKEIGAIPILHNPAWKGYNPDFMEITFLDKDGEEIGTGEEIQIRCTEAYKLAARENGAILVNAGDAWAYAYKIIPGISLYEDDGHHPSDAGSFLTACVFASTLFDLQIKDIPKRNLYQGDDAIPLAQAAWEFVSYYKEHGKSPDAVE